LTNNTPLYIGTIILNNCNLISNGSSAPLDLFSVSYTNIPNGENLASRTNPQVEVLMAPMQQTQVEPQREQTALVSTPPLPSPAPAPSPYRLWEAIENGQLETFQCLYGESVDPQ
jgi:hypothetical protein